MVDVGGEVGDAVGEGLLPQRRPFLHVLGGSFGAGEFGDRGSGRLGTAHRRELTAQGEGQMLGHRTQVQGHRLAGRVVGPGDHPLPQESVHLHETGLHVERVVAETQCVRTQHGRHRQQLDVESLALEVCPISVDDLTPVGIQVCFGDQAGNGRAQRHHLAKERDLGLGELLACVGHHKNRVCRRDEPESACGMRVPVSTDAGGVDKYQAVGQQRAGDADLEPGDVASLGQRVVGGH